MQHNYNPLGQAGLGGALLARRVTHVRMSSTYNALLGPGFEHIVELYGPGWGWRSRDQVVADINGGQRYFTEEDGTRAYLQVEWPQTILGGRPYVRTHPDCTRLNNLLYLPRA